MKSCKGRIASGGWSAHCLLSIVEVMTTSLDGRHPLHALEQCQDKLPSDFLQRLAERPETFVLLQCSCRLGCDGDCECSLTPLEGLSENIWKPFNRKNHKSIWKKSGGENHSGPSGVGVDPLASPPPPPSSLLSLPPRLTPPGRCICDGYPRLSSDLLVRMRTLIPHHQRRPTTPLTTTTTTPPAPLISTLSRIANFPGWRFRAVYDQDIYQGIIQLRSAANLCSGVWAEALNSFSDLLRSISSHKPMRFELPSFYLDLANYLILNLVFTRSLGALTAYLPVHPLKLGPYYHSPSPLKAFLARLVPLREDILKDQDGKMISAFCIDLVNLFIRGRWRLSSQNLKPVTSLGQAILFSLLYGGVCPRGAGSGIGCEPLGGGGVGTSLGGTTTLATTSGGGVKVEGIHLLEFEHYLSEEFIDKTKIQPHHLYQIRAGKIYTEDGLHQIERLPTDFCDDQKNFDLGEILSLRPGLYLLDSMLDFYEYKKPSSKNWRDLLKQHSYLYEEIERPRDFDHLREDARNSDYLQHLRTFFNNLPEEDKGMEGLREMISSSFLDDLINDAKEEEESGEEAGMGSCVCREDQVFWKAEFENRIDADRHRYAENEDVDALEELKELEVRLDCLFESAEDSTELTERIKKLLYDLDEVKFKHHVKERRRRRLNLYSAQNARHYLLSEKGVQILLPKDYFNTMDRNISLRQRIRTISESIL